MREVVIKGQKIMGGKAEGSALVSKDAICWLETLAPTGLVVEEGHDLQGKNVAGTVLVFPTGKGSTSGSYVICEMTRLGTAPKAILNTKAEAITMSGAILSDIPMVHSFDKDPTEIIETGDEVTVDGDTGTVRIKKQ